MHNGRVYFSSEKQKKKKKLLDPKVGAKSGDERNFLLLTRTISSHSSAPRWTPRVDFLSHRPATPASPHFGHRSLDCAPSCPSSDPPPNPLRPPPLAPMAIIDSRPLETLPQILDSPASTAYPSRANKRPRSAPLSQRPHSNQADGFLDWIVLFVGRQHVGGALGAQVAAVGVVRAAVGIDLSGGAVGRAGLSRGSAGHGSGKTREVGKVFGVLEPARRQHPRCRRGTGSRAYPRVTKALLGASLGNELENIFVAAGVAAGSAARRS